MTGNLQKKGKFYYAVINTKDKNGKRKQEWVNTKCTKKPDANRKLTEILSLYENDMYIKPDKMLFVDFMKFWLEEIIVKQIEPTTFDGYHTNVYTHIIPYFEPKNLLLTDVKTIHIEKYLYDKHSNGRCDGKGGLSANFVKKHYHNIKKALDYAVKKKMIVRNPAENVDLPKVKPYIAEYYTVEELEALLEASKGSDIEAAVFLAVLYGMRRGEVLGLRWQDINFSDEAIMIRNNRTMVKSREIVKGTKTKSSTRTFPMPPLVKDYLLQLKATQNEQKKLFGDEYKDSEYICRLADGSPLPVTSINHKFIKLLKDNNLKHIRFHDLRHSTASYLLKLGLTMKEIQVWLGHSTVSITMDLYSKVDFEMKKNTANKINDVFSNFKPNS